MPTKAKFNPVAAQAKKTTEAVNAVKLTELHQAPQQIRGYAADDKKGPKIDLSANAVNIETDLATLERLTTPAALSAVHNEALLKLSKTLTYPEAAIDPASQQPLAAVTAHKKAIEDGCAKIDAALKAEAEKQGKTAEEKEKLEVIRKHLEQQKQTAEQAFDDALAESRYLALLMSATPQGALSRAAIERAQELQEEGKRIPADKDEKGGKVTTDDGEEINNLADLRKGVKIGRNTVEGEPGGRIHFTISNLPFSGENRKNAIQMIVGMAAAHPATAPGQKIKITGRITKDQEFMQELVAGFAAAGRNPDEIRIERVDKKGKKELVSVEEYFGSDSQFKSIQQRALQTAPGQKPDPIKMQGAVLAGLGAEALKSQYNDKNSTADTKAEMLNKLTSVGKGGVEKAATLLNGDSDFTNIFNAYLQKVTNQQNITLDKLDITKLTAEQKTQIGSLLSTLDPKNLNALCSPNKTFNAVKAAKALYLMQQGNPDKSGEFFNNLPADQQKAVINEFIGLHNTTQNALKLNDVKLCENAAIMEPLEKLLRNTDPKVMDNLKDDPMAQANVLRAVATQPATKKPENGHSWFTKGKSESPAEKTSRATSPYLKGLQDGLKPNETNATKAKDPKKVEQFVKTFTELSNKKTDPEIRKAMVAGLTKEQKAFVSTKFEDQASSAKDAEKGKLNTAKAEFQKMTETKLSERFSAAVHSFANPSPPR